jgi:hypothetical protein
MALTIVPACAVQPAEPQLPVFEGERVDGLRAKLSAATNLELSEGHHAIDETIRLVVHAQVVGVNHVVDRRGELLRVETFRILDAVQIDWDVDQ